MYPEMQLGVEVIGELFNSFGLVFGALSIAVSRIVPGLGFRALSLAVSRIVPGFQLSAWKLETARYQYLAIWLSS